MTPRRLPGIRKMAICVKDTPATRRQIAAFGRAWMTTRKILSRKGLIKLTEGIDVALVRGQPFIARMYWDDVLCVNLDEIVARNDAPSTLLHELGHRVWFRVMRRKTRIAWVQDHHARKADKRPLPSRYAGTNPIEDHAEAFRLQIEGKLKSGNQVRLARLGPSMKVVKQRLQRGCAT